MCDTPVWALVGRPQGTTRACATPNSPLGKRGGTPTGEWRSDDWSTPRVAGGGVCSEMINISTPVGAIVNRPQARKEKGENVMKALNDKLMLTDILAHLKDLMTWSGMSITHSNCPKMRELITTTSGRIAQHQFEVFKYMHANGMYPVKNVEDSEIKEALAMHKQ